MFGRLQGYLHAGHMSLVKAAKYAPEATLARLLCESDTSSKVMQGKSRGSYFVHLCQSHAGEHALNNLLLLDCSVIRRVPVQPQLVHSANHHNIQ